MNVSALFVLIFICAVIANEDFRKIDAIKQEEPCWMISGICTFVSDCPHGHLAEKRGLCPEQKGAGIECCHALSIKETRCDKHGGVCMTEESFCNLNVVYREATNCPKETKCCIMTL